MFKRIAGKIDPKAKAYIPPTPPPLGLTKLLLHMDGDPYSTDFPDSSSNPKTITALVNAQIIDTPVKFGSGSLALDGTTGTALQVSASDDFDFADGDFTIDGWFYFVSEFTPANFGLFGSLTDCWLGVFVDATGHLHPFASSDGVSWDILPGDSLSSTIPVNRNNWVHIAFVRSGDVWTIYIDGVTAFTITQTGTLVSRATEDKRVGMWGNGGLLWEGYIDEFRISKGIARWTTDFTPPTAPYTAD